MRLVVYSLTGCLLCSTAVAKYCVKLPTCEELGYIYSADKYPNNRSIKCPFDTKKILLLDYCQAYGLTSCDSTSGECDECIVEKADGTKSNSGYWRYTRCNAGYSYKSGECPPTEVDTSKYPFTQGELNEEIGEIECVQSAQNIYCGYKSCNDGWDINSGNCIVHDCGSSYPYTSCDTNGMCSTCQSGTNTKYSAPTCNNGWYASGSSCVENACTGFNSTSSTIANCATTSSCQKGATTIYKCDTCVTDYELTDGTCAQNCSYTSETLPQYCSVPTDSCTKDSTTYYSTTCKTCIEGYEPSSGTCVAASCTGFGTSTTGCSSYNTCLSGTTTKYKCTACKDGYTINSGQCKANECAGYYAKTGCSSTSSDTCKSGTSTKYKCTACYTGYSLDSNKCTKTCKYTKTSKPTNCTTASSCQLGSSSGTKTYYDTKCTTCKSPYVLDSSKQCIHTCQNQGYSKEDYRIACQEGGATSNCSNYSICPDDSGWQKCHDVFPAPCPKDDPFA